MNNKKWMMGLFVATLMAGQPQITEAKILHEISDEQIVTRGVTHTAKEVLTENGWQDIHLLRIDLSDENVKLNVMDGQVLGAKETITNMAIQEGAVAGVNADFFDTKISLAPAFGPVIQDGEIEHAYNNEYGSLGPAKNMATFILDDEQNPMMDFYSVEMKATSQGQYLFDINSYNKLSSNLVRPIIIDDTYYTTNKEIVSQYATTGVYTVILKDNQITKVSELNEEVGINKGEMALLMSSEVFEQNTSYFVENQTLEIHQEIVLNEQVIELVENLEMSIGGGGLIMKNGQAYTGETHQVAGNSKHPRTIVATTSKDHELLLMTIDGRGTSIGANHTDLIEILTNLQVKDAMYFDGGGSTTMTVRDEGSNQVTLQNSPSDLVERKVTNGIGVFSTKEEGKLDKIIITPSSEKTFVGESIEFTLKGIDEYGNPINRSLEEAEISVAGIEGSFEGMKFYPQTKGTGLIVVTVGDVVASVEIEVTEPRALVVEPATLQVDAYASKAVQVYAIDEEGYKMPISGKDLVWQSTVGGVTAVGNTITASGEEIVTLHVQYEGLGADLTVIVGDVVERVESFEENTASWSGTTPTVEGKVEPSKDVKYHGEQSMKMTYTFKQDTNRQVAYTNFDQPIDIAEDAKSINMWLNAKAQGDTVRIQVEDAAGQIYYLNVVDKLNFTGWQYASVALPEEVVLPAKVTKLYVLSEGNQEERTSALYIDHFSITRGVRGTTAAAQDYLFDPMYKESLQPPTQDQYMVKVTGPTAINGMNLNEKTVEQITTNLNADASIVINASENNLQMALNAPVTYRGQFGQGTYETIDFIFVGTGTGSLRTHSEEEWSLLKQALVGSDANHLVLVMNHNPLTQFKDKREGEALHSYLVDYKDQTAKEVFVITTGGNEKEVHIEEGIRYIRLNGLNTVTGQVKDAEYLSFKVVGEDIYYTFEPMINQ